MLVGFWTWPKFGVVRRAAEISAARAEILLRQIQQVAIGHEVAVRIGPRPVRLRTGSPPGAHVGGGRVGIGVDARPLDGVHVTARVQLQRRLPVAEHVVRQPAAQADVAIAAAPGPGRGTRSGSESRDPVRPSAPARWRCPSRSAGRPAP